MEQIEDKCKKQNTVNQNKEGQSLMPHLFGQSTSIVDYWRSPLIFTTIIIYIRISQEKMWRKFVSQLEILFNSRQIKRFYQLEIERGYKRVDFSLLLYFLFPILTRIQQQTFQLFFHSLKFISSFLIFIDSSDIQSDCRKNNLFLARMPRNASFQFLIIHFLVLVTDKYFSARARTRIFICRQIKIVIISMLMKRKQNNIPQRERKWKKYSYLTNQEHKLFYDCQCGKRYVSFPAIFLHFQRKHKKKITNSPETREFELRTTNGEQIYFYFIHQRRPQPAEKHAQEINDGKNSNLGNILHILQNFSQENRTQLQGFICEKYLQKTLQNLIFFANEKFKEGQEGDVEGRRLLQNLPLYFNQFMLSQSSEVKFQEKQTYEGCCLALYQFSKWLNQKQLSNIIISINFINQQ